MPLASRAAALTALMLLAPTARAADPPAMSFAKLPAVQVGIDAAADAGRLELARHGVGHGGVNPDPLSDRVVAGAARLKPRLVRVFLQEFFFVYPESGRYDWSRLDPYLDSFARTGAKVVAAVTIKPRPLYPKIDPAVWRPADVVEWQRLVTALVKRYSVDRPIVTHWEIGNETDIGENGGCPYLIADPGDYLEYYKMTVAPVLQAFPGAKVGGCAVAHAGGDYLPRFLDLARRDKVRLDFISWHLYADDSARHAALVHRYRKFLEPFGERRPELMVTEWAKDFEPVSVEEMAHSPRRAALAASAVLAMHDAGLDWSFYYHLADQAARKADFAPFFRDPNIMLHHWNEVPHRFGLFGTGGEARPQYFAFRLLGMLGPRRLKATCDAGDVRAVAARGDDGAARLLLVNCELAGSKDRVATVRFDGLQPGRRTLVVHRVDRGRSWSDATLDLVPTERREIDVAGPFTCQVLVPGDSVTLVSLEPFAPAAPKP